MKNYVQTGAVITVPAPANVTSGKLVAIGSLIGIATKDALSGQDVALVTEGVIEYAKTAALAVSIGDKLYYDSANNVVNKTASGNTLVGVAVAAALAADVGVKFKLGATTV